MDERPQASEPALQEGSSDKAYWSARVSQGYRALCILEENAAIWFWIGSHATYERLLKER